MATRYNSDEAARQAIKDVVMSKSLKQRFHLKSCGDAIIGVQRLKEKHYLNVVEIIRPGRIELN